jgi:hypothetical protein
MNVFIKANYSFDHRFGSALSLIPRGEYRSRVYAILVSWKNPRHGVRVDEKIALQLQSRGGKRPLSCGFNSSNSTKMALHKNGTPFENLRNLDFRLHAPAHTALLVKVSLLVSSYGVGWRAFRLQFRRCAFRRLFATDVTTVLGASRWGNCAYISTAYGTSGTDLMAAPRRNRNRRRHWPFRCEKGLNGCGLSC